MRQRSNLDVQAQQLQRILYIAMMVAVRSHPTVETFYLFASARRWRAWQARLLIPPPEIAFVTLNAARQIRTYWQTLALTFPNFLTGLSSWVWFLNTVALRRQVEIKSWRYHQGLARICW